MQTICKMCQDAHMARPAHVRTAVERILESSDCPGWSVESLADTLNAAGVEASFSAVWRALQHLERAGVATRVDLGAGKTRYDSLVIRWSATMTATCSSRPRSGRRVMTITWGTQSPRTPGWCSTIASITRCSTPAQRGAPTRYGSVRGSR